MADGNLRFGSLRVSDLLIRNQQVCDLLFDSVLTERVFDSHHAFFRFFEDLVFPQSQHRPPDLLQLPRAPFIASAIHRTLGGPVSDIG